MTRRFAIALSFFLIELVHCASDPLLRHRQGKCTGNVSAISPVSCATILSSLYFSESLFFSSRFNRTHKTSFRQTTGILVRDINEGHCLSKAEICGSDCTSAYHKQCPPADDTMNPLDIASAHVPADILFCSYPTAIQPYIPTYFCNYVMICKFLWKCSLSR